MKGEKIIHIVPEVNIKLLNHREEIEKCQIRRPLWLQEGYIVIVMGDKKYICKFNILTSILKCTASKISLILFLTRCTVMPPLY